MSVTSSQRDDAMPPLNAATPTVDSMLADGGLARALLDQSPFSTVVYAPDGRPVHSNPAFEQYWNTKLTDVPAGYTVLSDPQLIAQGMLPRLERAFAGETVTLDVVRYDVAQVTGAGHQRWTQGNFFPIRNAAGSVIAVVLVHIDLTARVEADEALRHSEERARMALEAGQMGSWQWIVADGRVEWSETLERIHGLEPGTFPGTFEAYQSDIHPEDRARVLHTIRHSLEGTDHHLVYRIVRPDGAVRWLDARGRLLRDEAGHPQRLVGVCTDVTEDKEKDDATRFLAEASALLGSSLEYDLTLANIARLAVASLADYCIIDVLEAGPPPVVRRVATAHTNPARQALVEQVLHFPPPLDSDGIVARAIRTGQPQIVPTLGDARREAAAENRPEHQAVLDALGPRSILCVPMVARGTTVGTILLAYAESGRRYSDRELGLAIELARRSASAVDNARLLRETMTARVAAEQAAAEARAANRAKAEFLAVMSHELRTPLNAIGGYAELIEMGLRGPVTPEQVLDLARIQRSQRHLLSLINDLLNYAKLEAGRVQYQIERVPVAELLGSLEALIGPQVAAKGLEYRYVGPDDSLAMSADAEKVRQILLNLLSNAVKFTPAGGVVSVGAAPDGDAVRIDIADTGSGIPGDKLEIIFEPFVQLGRGLTQHNDGTGLGLAISRDLARAMHGELTASSVFGEGSTFQLWLPRAR
jgi:PAS domain S-box-containing protein